MKKLLICSLLSALALPVLAQTGQEVETVTISNSAQKIEAPSKTYRMSSEDFYQFKGTYSLSNGQDLSLFERGNLKYAQVSGQARHEIVATADNSFVALDRQLKMRIDLKDNGEVGGELYMVIPAQVQANGKLSGEPILMIAFQ